jgi:hypothetical protein
VRRNVARRSITVEEYEYIEKTVPLEEYETWQSWLWQHGWQLISRGPTSPTDTSRIHFKARKYLRKHRRSINLPIR